MKKQLNPGQAMVEFALVIPILLVMILGIFEAGRALWIYSAVTNASREAARLGSSVSDNGSGTPYYLDCSGIENEAITMGAPGQIQAGDVSITYDSGPGTSSKGDCASISADDIIVGDRVIVAVTGYYEPASAIPLVPFPTINFSSSTSRTIVKEAQLNQPASTSTAGGASTATQTSTATSAGPGPGPATSTATPTITPTPSLTPTLAPSDTPTATMASYPAAPTYVTTNWTKQGEICHWPIITVGSDSSWSSNPGSGPSQYSVYYNGTQVNVIGSNYPGNAQMPTWVDMSHGSERTYSFQGVFNGWSLFGAWLDVTLKCNYGNIIVTTGTRAP